MTQWTFPVRVSTTLVLAAAAGLAGCAGSASAPGEGYTVTGGRAELDPAALSVVEVRANAFTKSDQDNASVAFDSDGNAVVVWDSRRQESGTYGVYARRLDAAGRALSGEVRVNTHTAGMQSDPSVAVGPSGEAWFAWNSFGQDGQGYGVVARRFATDLTNATDEIAVNETRQGDQAAPVVAVDASGRALVAWVDQPKGGSARVCARMFGPDGSAAGPEFVVGVDSDAVRDTVPTVAAAPGADEFTIAWSRATVAGEIVGVFAKRLSGDGSAIGEEFMASVPDGRDHVEPSLAAGPDGGFLLAWMSGGAEGFAVSARWFDSEGRPVSAPATAADAAGGIKSGAAAAVDRGGRAVVAYNVLGQDGSDHIRAVALGRDARPVGAEFAPTRAAEGLQRLDVGSGSARAAFGPEGQLALAWGGDSALGDKNAANMTVLLAADLLARALQVTPPPVDDRAGGGSGELASAEPQVPPTWDPNWVPQEPLKDLRAGDGPDFGFEGVPGTGWTPPDPEMAVGPGAVVVITNGQIAAIDKAGSLIFRDEIEDSFGFWGGQGATNFVFDPEVHYDTQTDRFWAMACERSSTGKSMFLLAVSDDNNPAGTWYKYRKDVTALAGNDIDSPNLAMDKDAVYMTADFFSPTDKYLIYMLPKAAMLTGGDPGAGKSILITGAKQQSMGIPVTHDAGAPAQYIIQSTEDTTNTKVIFHAVTDPTGTPARVTVDVTVPTYRYPDQPTQKGSSSRPFLFEPRFWSCVYRNGSLWAVHHIRNASGARAIVRWYEFDMKGWPASGSTPEIKQWGEVDPGAALWAYFPSIGVDNQGNAAITFSRSGTAEYIGMWRVLRRWNDPAGTFRAQTIVKESTQPHTSGRWGDYSGTKADPAAPCVLWGHHEWTNTSAWRTWVARYDNFARSDVNKDCKLNVNDFIKFKTLFDTHDPIADWNGDGKWDINDWIAYQLSWNKGE